MSKEEKFDDIYMRAENGGFDKMYYDFGEGNKIGLDVKEVKKACGKYNVDFDEFLKYAQERKQRKHND